MENKEFLDVLVDLKTYCEKEQFKGWDPYDGLNSKVFNSIPGLNKSALCRLIVIQGFKRCPVNLRPIAFIKKEHNAKGIGLLLQAYCNMHIAVENYPSLAQSLGCCAELKEKITELADLLMDMQSKGDYHGACWGYNFGWQARRVFYFPKHTPTVVATSFCASALFAAYEITKVKKYLEVALSSANFVLKDLRRTPYNGGILFSYSPVKGNDKVFNASLLGSKLLSMCYKYTGNEEYKDVARQSIVACSSAQQENGAWLYGMLSVQQWVDSFHTGYNLDAMIAYREFTRDNSFDQYINKGFDYYINNFFESDGCPKYFNNKKYPIDIHCPGQLFVTLARLGRFSQYKDFASKVLDWTIENMKSSKGYFYYQLKQGINSKISYMRWSNAFMLNSLSYFLLANLTDSKVI